MHRDEWRQLKPCPSLPKTSTSVTPAASQPARYATLCKPRGRQLWGWGWGHTTRLGDEWNQCVTYYDFYLTLHRWMGHERTRTVAIILRLGCSSKWARICAHRMSATIVYGSMFRHHCHLKTRLYARMTCYAVLHQLSVYFPVRSMNRMKMTPTHLCTLGGVLIPSRSFADSENQR